ncbi:hypothetical protein K1W69_01355 [Hoeflea sp. WL0058]|uniref:Allene oxide cyclase barrel-like domain-containing protein n=1 Tax=Flavimaribacter sediminis TaxID=2865987 RepID=A0AAE2ZJJ4_9HYPH|nr:hypothetical protein [Flavimaribacter sediminis]MBW8635817.1 hypothetical protein [Flavimaribacter sediminis]
MFLKQLIKAAGLCATALTLSMPGARATEKCEPFSLVSNPDKRLVELIDHGEPGASHGDIRIGYTTMHDASGSEVGYIRWAVHALGRDENLGNAVIVLETGQIHLQYMFQPARPHDDSHSTVLTHGTEGIVLGGTGTFAHADGVFVLTVDGDSATFDMRLHCD